MSSPTSTQTTAAPNPSKPGKPQTDPGMIVRKVGTTNERALRYALAPDPKLTRLSRKAREALLPELPPVTAGALLGPAALARHFIASASAGRYRDLFALWELFRERPEECKPILAERQRALERARQRLRTATVLGLAGRAERVAEDVRAAEGLIWTWLRELLGEHLDAVAARPAVAAALLGREPDLNLELPDEPDERWLAEAADARSAGALPAPLEAVLGRHIDRLPASVTTLTLAQQDYPEQVSALLDRVDLAGPEIGSILAWARDHGYAGQLHTRVRRLVEEAAGRDRAEGLALWQAWTDRGVELPLPDSLQVHSLEGLDLGRPESAVLVRRLVDEGAPIDPQAALSQLADRNRQLAEKAYEAFVCAGLSVSLPLQLEGNPIVKEGTRCPACQAWTWVRPGHEQRCPRRAA
jgi:hypothetical protein